MLCRLSTLVAVSPQICDAQYTECAVFSTAGQIHLLCHLILVQGSTVELRVKRMSWSWCWSLGNQRHNSGRLPLLSTILQLPTQLHGITTFWLVSNYTAWWQRHTGVSSLSKATAQWCSGRLEPATYESQDRCPINSNTMPPFHSGDSKWWLTVIKWYNATLPSCVMGGKEGTNCDCNLYFLFFIGQV